VLKGRLAAIVSEFQNLLDHDVADFNRAAQELRIPPVVPAPKLES
jgi:hypothetical protein